MLFSGMYMGGVFGICLLCCIQPTLLATMYSLSVLTILPDNLLHVKSWIDHYLSEGVFHFYFVAKRSIQHQLEALDYYEKFITTVLVDDHDIENDNVLHNAFIEIIKQETEWVILAGANDYIYARDKYLKIMDVLSMLKRHQEKVCVPRKTYGSKNIESVDETKELPHSFPHRSFDYSMHSTERRIICKTIHLVKIISNGDDVRFYNNDGYYYSNSKLVTPVPLTQEENDSMWIHMNTYPLTASGEIDQTKEDDVFNAVEDTELAIKPKLYDARIYKM